MTHVREPVWRHLALVYDAPAGTVTTYLDYDPLQTLALSEPLNLTKATMHFGDVPNNRSDRRFVGQIADVRFTRAPFPAWKLLRATPHDLRGVSFEPRPGRLPAGSGSVDIRLRYGAVALSFHSNNHGSIENVTIRCGGWGMVTVIDSQLRAQQPLDVPAILNTDHGALYVRNLRTDGYAAAIRSDDREVPDGHVREFLARPKINIAICQSRGFTRPQSGGGQ